MNAHPEFTMAQARLSASGRKISDAELARFLTRLAALYRDPLSGNPQLSVALVQLAKQITSPRPKNRAASAKPSHTRATTQHEFEWLGALDGEAVRRFISDNRMTKGQLINLASARFSIPRSKLVRMGIQGVREEILSALQHEELIRIISQEAERGGANRSS